MAGLISVGRMLTPRNVLLAVTTNNMICRPSMTLSNKSIPEDTRRYTAAREFCAELFGLFNTLTVATAVERLLPKALHKGATKQLLNHVRNTDWAKLAPANQRLKAVVLISSLIGSALASGIVTPLMNNLVLNRVLDRITGKQKSVPVSGPAVPPRPAPLRVTNRLPMYPAVHPGFSQFTTRTATNVQA